MEDETDPNHPHFHSQEEPRRSYHDGQELSQITRISTIILIMGMLGVHNVTARWNGHQQRNELRIIVDSNIFTLQRHQIAEEVRHVVFHALPAMIEVSVHVDPQEQPGQNLHQITTHHVPGQIENKN